MCLIIIAHRMSPDYPLVLAANRDEFFSRPTRPAHEWPGRAIIAGCDLRAGGAWLGAGLDGRFAAVTNVREAGGNGAGRRSRGELPLDFLDSAEAPADFLASRAGRFAEYAGFNLLVGDPDSVCYASNRAPGVHEVDQGILGLSNGASGAAWPKVARGKQKMAELLSANTVIDADLLIRQMRDPRQAGERELPDTGLPDRQERWLSSMFVPAGPEGGVYGTRCISAFIRDRQGNCHFAEQNFNAQGETTERKGFDFSIAPQARPQPETNPNPVPPTGKPENQFIR